MLVIGHALAMTASNVRCRCDRLHEKTHVPHPSPGGVRRLTTRTFRTSVSGIQRRVSVANPGRVEAPEGGAIRVRAVEHRRNDTGVDRPHLIVGSSKFRLVAGEVGLGLVVVFGRRCHLDRHSRNQQRADDRKSCSLHGRLHFDIGGKCASLCECCVLMRRPLSHQLRPAWPARLRAHVAHLTFHGDLTGNRAQPRAERRQLQAAELASIRQRAWQARSTDSITRPVSPAKIIPFTRR
jgi:hypothetical protein